MSTNVAVEFAVKTAAVQSIAPPAPTMGFTQFIIGPLVWVNETKVIVPGNKSCNVTFAPAFGEPLLSEMLNVTSVFGAALRGPVLVTPRSA